MPSKKDMMKPTRVYAFDVDNTLSLGPFPGPIDIKDIDHLFNSGAAIVGLCGNYHVAMKYWPQWYVPCSFFGPYDGNKSVMLRGVKFGIQTATPHITDFVMVGNRAQDRGKIINGYPVKASSNDDGAARLSAWRFVSETEWVSGKR